ncbi:MAG: hypothetical protein A3G75_02745 [Verrucomicrobia bacterium RIFCSPLOWO2_12_FULL_64_8]|nr:MAG: hypothetical protein A3G75_02745 [Verrucomicrobia bacterium RIFCSPLOWO2_12_FULL_64_8]
MEPAPIRHVSWLHSLWNLLYSGRIPFKPPPMKSCHRPLLLLLLAALGALIAGCSTPKQDSTVPWGRPADWEGRSVPGMGGM